jgi:hypothetical protein
MCLTVTSCPFLTSAEETKFAPVPNHGNHGNMEAHGVRVIRTACLPDRVAIFMR